MYVNEKECEKAGLDSKEVEKIAKNLSKYCKQAKKLGLEIFGGSGEGYLRFFDNQSSKALIVANLDSDNWNGGDGSIRPDKYGYLRGE